MKYKTAVEKGWLVRGYHNPINHTCDYGYPSPCGKPGVVMLFNHNMPGDIFCCEQHFEEMQIFREGVALGKFA